jgi:hypothetical protein
MSNPLKDPRFLAAGATASGSLVEKAAEAAAGTRTVQSVVNTTDNKGVEIVDMNNLNEKVVNASICGRDELGRVPKLFCARPVDRLFEDYLHHSTEEGACFCVQEVFGDGKSTTVGIVTRGRHPQGPKRFLVVTPDFNRTGSIWLEQIKLKLGLVKSTPGDELVRLLFKALTEDDKPTDDKFRVTAEGERRHRIKKDIEGRPLLVLEDLNPEFFAGATEIVPGDKTTRLFEREDRIGKMEAIAEFGEDAFDFLRALGAHCNAHGWVAIVTTSMPRVAKFLHYHINGGTKLKIPLSQLCEVYNEEEYVYNENTFVFEEHFTGFWNDASKMELLLKIFPGNAEGVTNLVTSQNMSIRSCKNQLKLKARFSEFSEGASNVLEQSGSPDKEGGERE